MARKTLLVVALGLATALTALAQQVPLPGTKIPQFVDPLPTLGANGIAVAGGTNLTLTMCEFKANVMPSTFVPAVGTYTGTYVWGYVAGTQCPTTTQPTYLGPAIVAVRGTPTEITFVNNLGSTTTTNVLAYKNSTDQTLHWADPLNGEGNLCNMNIQAGTPPTGTCAQNVAGAIPAVVHLHGGEVPPQLDGGPDAWFTSDGTYVGHSYYSKDGSAPKNYSIYRYPNTQEASYIWFHDHTLGATRLNVYMGLAGAFPIVDPSLTLPTGLTPLGLSTQDLIIPVIIQDRMFDTNGQLFFPAVGVNPEHPYWVPEFLGDTIAVNGKVWPYLDVEPRRYRFLFLNGSNARSYSMDFQVQGKGKSPTFWQIGTDGGYLDAPAAVPVLTMMSGERADVIIDFSAFKPGDTLILRNSAKAPFPGGRPPQGTTVGTIMQFRVKRPAAPIVDNSYNPALGTPLRPGTQALVRLVDPVAGTVAPGVTVANTRELTLNEVLAPRTKVGGVQYPGGPLEILVNNTKWSGESPRPYNDFTAITLNGITTAYSELPNEGDTEVWEIVNLTADAHPMHTHLTQFQLINRQNVDIKNFTAAYAAAFPAVTGDPKFAACIGGVYCPDFGPPLDYNTGVMRGGKLLLGGNPDVTPFLLGVALPPASNEAGWKDTIMAPPGMVTRIAVRFAPTDLPASTPAVNAFYPFDPNGGHGYVWHCHIVDHEDNEMMRPDLVTPNGSATRTYIKGIDY